MATTYKIPKLTDRAIIEGLARIVAAFDEGGLFSIAVYPPYMNKVALDRHEPVKTSSIEFVLSEETTAISRFTVLLNNNNAVLMVVRKPSEIVDEAMIEDGWAQNPPEELKSRVPKIAVALTRMLRAELQAADLEASRVVADDTAWDRYRTAQMEVVNSLQQATETLLIKSAEANARLDEARSARYAALEEKLRSEVAAERDEVQAEASKAKAEVERQLAELEEREKAFNTKESRYVGRQKQDEQVKQVQEWLNDWKLTAGTSAKRLPVLWAYIAALVATGGFSAATIVHNFNILDSAQAISALAWWQWVLLLLKTIVPVGAFTTFMIYFIRWTNAWARQHADEEFRNRTRLIDIGRSSWLLEAVRDAQETGKDLPPELIKELSRNLFSMENGAIGDLDPQAFSDLLLQGLSCLRIKSPDGSEIEAQRGKPK